MREINPLNHAQLSSTIRGGDRNFRIRPKRSFLTSYAILIFIILLAVFGTLFIFAGVVE